MFPAKTMEVESVRICFILNVPNGYYPSSVIIMPIYSFLDIRHQRHPRLTWQGLDIRSKPYKDTQAGPSLPPSLPPPWVSEKYPCLTALVQCCKKHLNCPFSTHPRCCSRQRIYGEYCWQAVFEWFPSSWYTLPVESSSARGAKSRLVSSCYFVPKGWQVGGKGKLAAPSHPRWPQQAPGWSPEPIQGPLAKPTPVPYRLTTRSV